MPTAPRPTRPSPSPTDVDESDVTTPTDSDDTANTVAIANGATVGITASASDADATTNTVTYAITAQSCDGALQISDSSTGVVTVANTNALPPRGRRDLHRDRPCDIPRQLQRRRDLHAHLTDVDEVDIGATKTRRHGQHRGRERRRQHRRASRPRRPTPTPRTTRPAPWSSTPPAQRLLRHREQRRHRARRWVRRDEPRERPELRRHRHRPPTTARPPPRPSPSPSRTTTSSTSPRRPTPTTRPTPWPRTSPTTGCRDHRLGQRRRWHHQHGDLHRALPVVRGRAPDQRRHLRRRHRRRHHGPRPRGRRDLHRDRTRDQHRRLHGRPDLHAHPDRRRRGRHRRDQRPDATANTEVENAADNTAVGITASATDADATDDTTYSMVIDTAGCSGYFDIGSSDGIVRVDGSGRDELRERPELHRHRHLDLETHRPPPLSSPSP